MKKKKLLSNKVSSSRNVVEDLPLTSSGKIKKVFSYLINNKSAEDSPQQHWGMTAFFNRTAFTLIELLVVVLIIGILAAVAVPQYQKAVWKSRFTQAKILVKNISDAQELYYLANGSYSADITELSINVPATSVHNEVCYFPWGYCNIRTGEYGLVACDLQKNGSDFIRYEHWLDNSAYPHTTICITYSKDLKNLTNQICKAETRKSNPGEQTNRLLWNY